MGNPLFATKPLHVIMEEADDTGEQPDDGDSLLLLRLGQRDADGAMNTTSYGDEVLHHDGRTRIARFDLTCPEVSTALPPFVRNVAG